jgi:hypothetical protein
MKKAIQISISVIFALCLFLNSFSIVSAESGPSGVTVTPLTGGSNYTLNSIDLSTFAGAYQTKNGDYQPTGFAKNETKFENGAFSISGIPFGTQTTCVNLANYAAGWRGSIYQWNGSKWGKLATTIVEGKDGEPVKACATTYGNGIYALIVYFDLAAAPKTSQCVADMEWYSWNWDYLGNFYATFTFTGDYEPELGTSFKWKIYDISPEGFLTPTSGTGTIALADGHTSATITGLTFPAEMFGRTDIAFTVEIYLPGCHIYDFFGRGIYS